MKIDLNIMYILVIYLFLQSMDSLLSSLVSPPLSNFTINTLFYPNINLSLCSNLVSYSTLLPFLYKWFL